MQKVYSRINWENDPSTNTPINEKNLNKMDYAINVIDDRVVNLQGYQDKAATSAANAKTSETNAKTSETNAKASELLAKQYAESAFSGTPDGYEQLVEDVSLLDIQTTTSTTLQGSKDGGAKLNYMVGATEQKQYTGKNFIGYGTATGAGYYSLRKKVPYTKNGITAIRNDDDSVTLTGTTTADNVFFNLNYNNATTNFAEPNDYILNGGSTLVRTQVIIDSTLYTSTGEDKAFTISEDAIKSWVRVQIEKAETTVNETIYPMVRLASVEDDTYEPYVGNAPSPSPEYQQSLNNEGDCVKMMQGHWATTTGEYTTNDSNICCKNAIPCETNDIIKIDTEDALYVRTIFYNNGSFVSSNKSSTASNTYSITVPNGVDSFKFYVGKSTAITPETVGKISLTVNGKYVGQIVEHGKNHLKYNKKSAYTTNGITFTFLDDGGVRIQGTTTASNTFCNLNYVSEKFSAFPSGNYAISGGINNIVNVQVIINSIGSNNKSFTIDDSTENCWVRLQISGTGKTIDEVVYPMVRSADVEDDTYEPYAECVATYYTNEPTRDSDRFVQIDNLWQVERNRKVRIVDGINVKVDTKSTVANHGYLVATNTANNNSAIAPNALCSHFIPKSWYSLENSNETGIAVASNRALFAFFGSESEINTIDLANEWFSNNPTEIEYLLRTPTYEVLDTASQIALNSLKSFNGATYIEIDSRVQPSEVSFDFGTSHVGARVLRAENDNLIDYVERQEMKAELEELRTALVALGSEV